MHNTPLRANQRIRKCSFIWKISLNCYNSIFKIKLKLELHMKLKSILYLYRLICTIWIYAGKCVLYDVPFSEIRNNKIYHKQFDLGFNIENSYKCKWNIPQNVLNFIIKRFEVFKLLGKETETQIDLKSPINLRRAVDF